MEPEEKVKFLKAAWDAIGSEFGSRHTQYEMFYAGARFVTTGHSYRTFDWAGATGMVDDLMAPTSSPTNSRPAPADMKVAIVNLGQIVSGDWRDPFVAGDTIVTEGERIVSVGTAPAARGRERRRGDRRRRHDGDPGPDRLATCTSPSATTRRASARSAISKATCTAASRRRSRPPRCTCRAGRATSRASRRSRSRRSAALRTTGRAACGCIAGSVILEPGLKAADFRSWRDKGVRLAKAGFGAVKTAYDYVPLVADAKAAGLITTCHTGGSSIPGSGAITGDHLLKMHPHVSFHINGGPTAMPDADFERVIRESEIALQVCTAGNLRTTLLCARLAEQHGAFDRFIIATDTPTGSGIMPLGMLYTIAHLREPDRHAAGALHLRRDRQQCARLRPRQRLPRARQGRRHRADRRAGRRHAGRPRSPRSSTATSRRSARW